MKTLTPDNIPTFFDNINIGDYFTYSEDLDFVYVYQICESKNIKIDFKEERIVQVVENNKEIRKKMQKLENEVKYYETTALCTQDVMSNIIKKAYNEVVPRFYSIDDIVVKTYKDPLYYYSKKSIFDDLSYEAKKLVNIILNEPEKIQYHKYIHKGEIRFRRRITMDGIKRYLHKIRKLKKHECLNVIQEVRNAVNQIG